MDKFQKSSENRSPKMEKGNKTKASRSQNLGFSGNNTGKHKSGMRGRHFTADNK